MSSGTSQFGITQEKAKFSAEKAFSRWSAPASLDEIYVARSTVNPYTYVPNESTFGLLHPRQISSIVRFVASTLVLRPPWNAEHAGVAWK
jgi:hypothetical protein